MKHQIQPNNLKNHTPVWLYLSMIALSWAHVAHTSSNNLISNTAIMNNLIVSYSGESICESMPEYVCDMKDSIIASNSGQNIATKYPVATEAMNRTITVYQGDTAFPSPPRITFGTPTSSVTVTISMTQTSNITVTGSAPTVVADGNPVVHIIDGSDNPPFLYTPDDTITFIQDATNNRIVINGDVYIYGSLVCQRKLTVNGNLYIDSSAGQNNLVIGGAGDLVVAGTMYITGNGNNQTTCPNLNLDNIDLVINDGGILLIGTGAHFIMTNGTTTTINGGGRLLVDNQGGQVDGGMIELHDTCSLTIHNGGTLEMDKRINTAGSATRFYMTNSSSLIINAGGLFVIANTVTANNGGQFWIDSSSITMSIDPAGSFQLRDIGRITGTSATVNLAGNTATYYIAGSTGTTLKLQDNSHGDVATITFPAIIQTFPYQTP